MNKTNLQQAELLFNKALECYLGVDKDKNLVRAKDLLLQATALGLSKACNLLGDWYLRGVLSSNCNQEAVEMYNRGCELGDSYSFCRLAQCHKNGHGVPQSDAEAMRLYRQSAQMGNAEACFYIAAMFEKGDGAEKSAEEAFGWYKKGAEMGNAECTCNLAFCYYRGKGTVKDVEKAKEFFRQNADLNATIQRNLGVIFYQGTPQSAPDKEQAVRWLTKAALNGDVTSMLYLARMYWKTGERETALDWYRKAAECDCRKGGYLYAFRLYQHAEGQQLEAFRWMKRAAENGHVSAQFMLGLFYENGVGTPEDHANAFYWFKLAAEKNYEQAYCHVGRYLRDGRIVKEDYKQAIAWFEKATHSRDNNVVGEALYDYGMMHLMGLGVKKDRKVAEDFLVRAAQLGCLNAKNRLRELETDAAVPKAKPQASNASIKKEGNIREYVEVFMPGVLEMLNIFIDCAMREGLIKPTEDDRLQWTFKNIDFAQWMIDVSDALGLYDKDADGGRCYWSLRFSRLFITCKNKPFKAVDLRHYMSRINNKMGEHEVRHIETLLKVRAMAYEEIKLRGL